MLSARVLADSDGEAIAAILNRIAVRRLVIYHFTRKAPYFAASCMLEERRKPLRLHHLQSRGGSAEAGLLLVGYGGLLRQAQDERDADR
jgi:hypothetical protein